LQIIFLRLDNRVKGDLSANLRPSSARDFRLKIEEPEEEAEPEVASEVRGLYSN
jgi:hypothetical protein